MSTTQQPTSTLNFVERGLLWLIPLLAALGASLPLAGPFFAFRVAALMLFLVSVVSARGKSVKTPAKAIASAFALSLVLFGLLGMFFGETSISTWAEIASVISGAALVLGVLIIRSPAATLRHLVAGWTVAFYACGAIAAREILFGIHWSTYFQTEHLEADWGVASTFGNPNNYALFLLASVGILAVGYANGRRTITRWLNVIALISIPFLALQTQSRLGTILTAVALAIVALGYKPARRAALSAACLAVLVAVALQLSGNPLQFRDNLVANAGASTYSIAISGLAFPVDLSTFVRWNLTQNGLLYFADAPFIGNGPGSYEVLSLKETPPFPTFGMSNPHNGLIEILSQYGIVPSLLFVLLWVVFLTIAIRALRNSLVDSRQRLFALALLAYSVTLPFSLVMNSAYLDPSNTWLATATYTVLAVVVSLEVQADSKLPSSTRLNRNSTAVTQAPGDVEKLTR